MFFYDPTWIIILPALILTIWAQSNINSAYSKYSRVMNRRGMTGYDAARKILDMNGLQNVKIEHIAGRLSDHYDPRTNVVRLSDGVYSSTSVAAIGVAAHEVGHAVQHAVGYAPIRIRNAIVPVVSICSQLAVPLFILGLIFSSSLFVLTDIGIILFAAAVVFHLITLPVEINASRRALSTLESTYMLDGEEVSGAKKVLTAAAMTYIASAATALLQLLRLVAIRGRGD